GEGASAGWAAPARRNGSGQPNGASIPHLPDGSMAARRTASVSGRPSHAPWASAVTSARPPFQAITHSAVCSGWEARSMPTVVSTRPSWRATLPRVPDSVLSDGTIRRLVEEGRIVIKPWEPELVQPASVDLRLGDSFRVFHNHRAAVIDLRDGPPAGLTEEVVASPEDGFVIHPGEFCLGRTAEWVELPNDVVARIEGKSSLGRLGLIVHATAGFIDPGWKGTLTLELNNLTRVPIKLYPGLLIAQLSFMGLDRAAERPYGSKELGSHYQGQVAATESRYMR